MSNVDVLGYIEGQLGPTYYVHQVVVLFQQFGVSPEDTATFMAVLGQLGYIVWTDNSAITCDNIQRYMADYGVRRA